MDPQQQQPHQHPLTIHSANGTSTRDVEMTDRHENTQSDHPAETQTSGAAGNLTPSKQQQQTATSSNEAAPHASPQDPSSLCFSPSYLTTPLISSAPSSDSWKSVFGSPPPPLNLAWHDIDLFVETRDGSKRQIMSGVSGQLYCGELCAVIGPSGSSKTTLLSLLAGGWRKARASGLMRGSITVNDQPIAKRHKRSIAYVAQDDIMIDTLTVEQTLRYSALLNLPRSLTRSQKLARVEQAIQLLGLDLCRHTRIGSEYERGASGGERKRASVAAEMLTNPSIIISDEPTSGLDASSAARLIATFRSLARGQRAVIASIHQPSSQVFAMFDKVLLLCQGRSVFYGSPSQVTAYFSSIELMRKPFYSPPDFMLELVADITPEDIKKAEDAEEQQTKANGKRTQMVSNGSIASISNNGHSSVEPPSSSTPDAIICHVDEGPSAARQLLVATVPPSSFEYKGEAPLQQTLSRLPIIFSRFSNDLLKTERGARIEQQQPQQQAYAPDPLLQGGIGDGDDDDDGDGSVGSLPSKWPLTWWEQFVILLSRSFAQQRGNLVTLSYSIEIACIAIVCSLVWFRTPDTIDELVERTGGMFFITMFWAFTPLFNAIDTFPSERALIMKERGGGYYRLSAYWQAKTIAAIPVELMYPTLFLTVVYWCINLKATAGAFFSHLLTILLSTLTAHSFGLFISSAVVSMRHCISVASVSMLTLMLVSGFYAKLDNIPIWLRWASYLAFPKYTYSIIAYIQFSGRTFECGNADPQTTDPRLLDCPVSGETILSSYALDTLPLWANIVILIALLIVFRFLAYLALRRTTQP